ncbi:MAG: LacI family DNA-binding transcriptional regulator [Eubacteriales bacterium]|nr:LacI family DNA-binding transcriptional regulator [Eubacteriales bacterium]
MAVIKDVARLAGVSVASVSKVLNNAGSVSNKTREKIESAIKELDYIPSTIARSMRTRKTNMIAVVVPDIIDDFFANVFNYIKDAAQNLGYTPILYSIEDNIEMLKNYLGKISLVNFDGAIFCFLDEDEVISNFEKIQMQIPITLFSWNISNVKFSAVVTDVFEGEYKAARYLIEKGEKRIAFVGGPENSRISKQKFDGFAKAMREAGLEIKDDYLFNGHCRYQTGYQAAIRFSRLAEMPTAVVAAGDNFAAGLIKYFTRKGIKVPDDIKVIGFDNIPLASIYEPAISTVSIPIEQMSREAVNLLVNKITGREKANRTIIFKNELLIRNSTDRDILIDFEF